MPTHLTTSRACAALLVLAASFACAEADRSPPVAAVTGLESPAGPMSGEPNLAVDAGGRIHMTWLERNPDSTVSLRLAIHDSSGWSSPVDVTRRSDLFVNWADFPSVFVAGSGRILVHWLQKDGVGRYSYNVMVRQSSDGGATWSDPRVLHDDGVAAEHGFLSFFQAGGDSVEAVWLATAAGEDPGGHRGAMQLGNARLGPDGGVTPNVMVDARICDCCQTSAAVTSQGPVVVYRDRSGEEIRDISVLRRVNGAWTEPARVHADDWHIEGCPVNGPAVDAEGDLVAVAWFTGARDTARVNVAFSSDAGATFGAPVRVDDGNPAGRVDVELDGAGRALVTWLERTGDAGAEVRIRAITREGAVSGPKVIATSQAARSSGFPRMVRSGNSLMIAWTQPGDTSRVRVATAALGRPGK